MIDATMTEAAKKRIAASNAAQLAVSAKGTAIKAELEEERMIWDYQTAKVKFLLEKYRDWVNNEVNVDREGKKQLLTDIAHLSIDPIDSSRGHFKAASRATLLADILYEVSLFTTISFYLQFLFI